MEKDADRTDDEIEERVGKRGSHGQHPRRVLGGALGPRVEG
jgi:hypothetical protein